MLKPTISSRGSMPSHAGRPRAPGGISSVPERLRSSAPEPPTPDPTIAAYTAAISTVLGGCQPGLPIRCPHATRHHTGASVLFLRSCVETGACRRGPRSRNDHAGAARGLIAVAERNNDRRAVAERVTDRVVSAGRAVSACRTATTLLPPISGTRPMAHAVKEEMVDARGRRRPAHTAWRPRYLRLAIAHAAGTSERPAGLRRNRAWNQPFALLRITLPAPCLPAPPAPSTYRAPPALPGLPAPALTAPNPLNT